ncbi:NAD-dependent epimerase/dehydratase family protein [Sulfitobacter donghicola]|uniref:3-beta hydroxysteroid dehydrogenase n=1 Tax=Sulfitobacter donghicola DSW-25 = KCTC 12864 = JCM 14565 TaxID=1300350 RepID=A0A073IF57_9RHOB|nr:NAD(P)-dependent oxidoreductase [Sulfitobacter donghicola]KEJ88200.1 3-beta hydroxysteroid dehydrogenase [Sulfitobacter donghicola DSW-25 = KCTC 12864 = JCM 14565]KIN68792.1 3-beta hydroxysteroid dehydrogenase/isomerase [Sulfitobacter donghicola DSW-25 = KCTC 12864 = JCM 14565]
MPAKLSKIVLTGAAGRLGSYLREPLSKLCDELVSTDIKEQPGTLYEGETYMQADLASFDEMNAVIEGAEMVVHMGAFVDEGPFEQLLGPNFVGSYNIWEAASRHGVRRVVYGSSIHAVGMYPKNEFIDTEVAHRPDTFYGLAKCFTEDLGRMYWEKRGLESVHMRILSCAQVNNARALGSWLSYDDLIQLVTRCIETPVTGFAVIYGVSNNDRAPVDNAKASFLGYRPTDNAEQFAEEVLANEPPMDPHDPNHMCHGGPFAGVELGNSGLAGMNVIDDTKKS